MSALCAVQPPKVAARGYRTVSVVWPSTWRHLFRIARLLRVVFEVTNEEVPTNPAVLCREGVERRHIVVVGQTVDVRCLRRVADRGARIAARFEQQHLKTCFRQARREGTAAGA